VVSQNYLDIELIVIDSESSDITMDIVAKYADKYQVKSVSEPDEGISDAFNKGIHMATGDWIIFLGAGDTFVHSKVISDVVELLSNRKQLLAVWGNVILMNEEGEVIKKIVGKYSKSKFKRYMSIPHQATFHSKQLYKTHGLYLKKYKVAMDYDLLLREINNYDKNNYMDYDIAYMLTGGISQNNIKSVLNEFKQCQIDNHIWPKYIAYLHYLWGNIKHRLKPIVTYNYVRIFK